MASPVDTDDPVAPSPADDSLPDGDLPLDAYAERAFELMRTTLRFHAQRSDDALAGKVAWQQRQLALTAQACAERGIEVPEARLATIFGLDRVELLTLWLAALPYVDSSARSLIASASGRGWVSLELAGELFARGTADRKRLWMAGRGGGNLRRAGLIRLMARDGDPNPLRQEIIPGDDVVGMFQAMRVTSAELQPFAEWVDPALTLDDIEVPAPIRDDLRPLLAGFWDAAPEAARGGRLGPGGLDRPRGLAVLVEGSDGIGKTTALKALAGTLDRAAIVVDGESMRTIARLEVGLALRAMARESALFSELVIVRHADGVVSPENPAAPVLARALEALPGVVIFCLQPGAKIHRSLQSLVGWRVELEVPRERDVRAAIWAAHWDGAWQLEGAAGIPDFGRIDARHGLDPQRVARAVRAGSLLARGEGRAARDANADAGPLEVPAMALDLASRNQVHTDLGELAAPMRAERGLDDLVLPPELKQRLVDIIEAARNRDQVLHEWRLSQTVRTGLGLCCLFDGDPGTGKTLSAEVVAKELGLQLMRINTSQLFDKYIGETEKNLERVFTRARPSTHLLLFDEADALFSKRTTVKASNDRYSNMNVGVLLQLVEGYDGVVVLTTNLKQNIDKAFERRIMFKISFPLPEEPERDALWRIMVPDTIPTEGEVDFEALAEVELSGGEIKNALMHAAYSAARAGQLLDTDALLEAAWRSVADSGRLIRSDEGWPDF